MKRLFVLILAALMLLSLAACKKAVAPKTDDIRTENTQVSSENESQDDPAEYSMEYWEEKYPGENVCPFTIEIDGVEYNYYRVSGLDEGTMITWIETPLNWNGWHLLGDDIVNADETYKMTDDWAGEEPEQYFSSFCTVTTEPYTPPER
ncbi:MAG: hypothetical protein MJ085_03370 [Clostridia bacterium]|nr:hypothetical protein [Clostridia bacterium]